ncbi:GNAT_acetyltr_2 domain-containing protein/tRNA_bind_2 domain-containing protein [Cephalotus follicularis]|uniref:GNAT_acetyltr_2 domain-containing protein/tRNA_bind_2 domain-containing protein n=1 Tax=Cephalotus follicularis TaxID=3775 RepID=A0A1Q3B5U7_CEPFO|nr:GNAT_acetyltr_2 domain-containing protein/tRNA_bind_2 domain-containing protein [Cephalotus follicularis]
MKSLGDGHQPFGDQIPWKFCEQFRDTVFPTLSGARIVRIATHPSAMRLGYGSTAVELLTRYYEGQLTPISEVEVERIVETPPVRVTEAAQKVSLLEENIKPRTDLPHLLVHLCERQPEKLHYIGVSFGLTLDLYRFWRKHRFAPFYISQVPSTVTGEHTCMVLKPLNNDEIEVSGSDELGFFGPFYQDFRRRFARLLITTFREMEYKLAMSILDPKINFSEVDPSLSTSDGFWRSLMDELSPYDVERLRAYTDNLVDYHLITDFVPVLAHLYFRGKIPITLSYLQASVLLFFGLQGQNLSYVEVQMKLERQQILSLFIKVMKKFHKYLSDVASEQFVSTLPRLKERVLEPHSISMDDDLNEAAKQVEDGMKTKMEGLLNPDFLQQFAIVDREADFDNALQNGGKLPSSGLVSVKSNRSKVEKRGMQKESHKNGKKRSKDDRGYKSNKKIKS